MIDDLDGTIGAELRRLALPAAPDALRARVLEIPVARPAGRSRPRTGPRRAPWAWLAVAVVALVAVIGAVLAFGGASPGPIVPAPVQPSGSPSTSASMPTTVDGKPVLSVSEAIRQRDARTLGHEPVAIRGFWSGQAPGHSCAPPDGQTGDLEIYCHDREFGITELDEHIEIVDQHGFVTPGTGPWLTPFVGNDLAGAATLFELPYLDGQLFPPVPIVVVGHFDDPRAADCRPVARKLCTERLVIDRIVTFDPGSMPTPGPTPTPTPFPFADPPPAPYAVDQCVGDKPTSFVGWKTLRELGIEGNLPDEVQFIVIAKDPIPIGDWFDDPNDGTRYRLWGQRVCYGSQFEEGAISFTALPGTEFREYPDGHHEPTTGP